MILVIILFIVSLVLGMLFLAPFKRKTITEKDLEKTDHNDVII